MSEKKIDTDDMVKLVQAKLTARREVEGWRIERLERAAMVLDAVYGLEEMSPEARVQIVEDRTTDYLAAWWNEKRVATTVEKSGASASEICDAIDEANAHQLPARDTWIEWIRSACRETLVTLVSTR